MFPLNLLCKIGSYLHISHVLKFLLVSKKINCELFWRLYYKNNYHRSSIKVTNVSCTEEYYMAKKLISFLYCLNGQEFLFGKFNLLSSGVYEPSYLPLNFKNIRLELISILEIKGLNSFCGNYFPNLKKLSINEKLKSFEDNYAPKLTSLNIRKNLLQKIDLSSYPELTYLDISNNSILHLDLELNTKLHHINIKNNPLENFYYLSAGTLVLYDYHQANLIRF